MTASSRAASDPSGTVAGRAAHLAGLALAAGLVGATWLGWFALPRPAVAVGGLALVAAWAALALEVWPRLRRRARLRPLARLAVAGADRALLLLLPLQTLGLGALAAASVLLLVGLAPGRDPHVAGLLVARFGLWGLLLLGCFGGVLGPLVWRLDSHGLWSRGWALPMVGLTAAVATALLAVSLLALEAWVHLLAEGGAPVAAALSLLLLGAGLSCVAVLSWLALAPRPYRAADVAPDGAHLAAVRRGALELVGLATGSVRALPDAVRAVRFDDTGRRVAAPDRLGAVRVHDVATGALTHVLGGLGPRPTAVAFAPDGLRLAAVDDLGAACIWDLGTGQPLRALSFGRHALADVAFSADSLDLVVARADGHVSRVDAMTGTPEPAASPDLGREESARVGAVTLSRDGALVAVGFADAEGHPGLGAFRTGDGSLVRRVAAEVAGPVTALAFSRDGARLASLGPNATVQVWDVRTGALVERLGRRRDVVTAVALDADGRGVLTGGKRLLRLWDVERAEVRALAGPGVEALGLSHGPAGDAG